jgi:glycosyltransferase involved in cell wall biosynthesis
MQKNILYITTDISFLESTDAGGGVVENSHLRLFKLNDYKIRILYLNTHLFSTEVAPEIISTKKVALFGASEVQIDEIQLSKSFSHNFPHRIKRLLTNLTNYYYPFVNKKNTLFLENYIHTLDVNLIWAQWSYPGLLCSKLKVKNPIFYVHHDWQYKLVEYKKKKSLKRTFYKNAIKKIEKTFIKKFTAVICLSYSDYKMLEKENIPALYLPITYDSNPIETKKEQREKPVLVHLGNLNTTANRVGLEEFIQFSWKEIKRKYPTIKLEIIGREVKNNIQFMDVLKKDPNIDYFDFVEDLDAIIHPYDIHIIPWNYNTGTRTRVPLIFKHKQCLLAMQKGVENINDVKHLENSILAKSWGSYTENIIEAIENHTLRKEISESGYETYKRIYLHNSQKKNLDQFITSLIN